MTRSNTHRQQRHPSNLAQHVAEITDGRGAHLSYEVTGTNQGLELAEATEPA